MDKNALLIFEPILIRQLISFVLEELDYRVAAVDNDKEAFRVLDNIHMNIVILDLDIPSLNGIGLIERIRFIEHYRKTPIIIAGNPSSEDLIMEGIRAGANRFLFSPFTYEQLSQELSIIKRVRTLE
jgi:DNA-binding response OmpR family regulator